MRSTLTWFALIFSSIESRDVTSLQLHNSKLRNNGYDIDVTHILAPPFSYISST